MPKPNAARPTGRPTDDEIAKRAFELYLQRGSVPGYEMDDWLQAEAELSVSAAPSVEEPAEARASGGGREPSSGRRGNRRETAPAGSSRRTLRP